MANFKINKYQIILLLIFVSAIALRGYRAMGKDSLFIDENLSVVLSNYGHYGFAWPAVAVGDDTYTYEGKELRDRIFGDDNRLENIAYDLWNLRRGTRDTPHTNLYYSLLRLSFWNADTTDLVDVVRRGVLLNVLLFILGFFFLFRLCKLFFRDNWLLIFCALAIVALNPVSVSNSIFIRPYQLQEAMFIVFAYFVVACAYRLKMKGRLFDTKWEIVGLSGATALTLLSGYFSVPFVLMLWGGLGLYVFLDKEEIDRKKTILQLAISFFCSIILLFLLYPVYLDGFSGNRGEEAMGKLSLVSVFSGIGEVVSSLSAGLGCDVLSGFGIAFLLLVILLVRNRKKITFQQVVFFYLLVCAVIWLLFTFYLAPVKKIRYIVSIIPLLLLVFPLVYSFLSNKKVQYLAVFATIGFFVFKTATERDVYWGRVDVGEYYKKDVETPLIVAGVYSPWLQTSLTPYFTDGRTIIFAFSMEEFVEKLNQYETAYVILGGEALANFSIPENYKPVEENVFDGSGIEALNGRFKVKRVNEKE